MFANKNVHKKVNIIHKVLNDFFLILRFIPNKNLTFDDKVLTWMNELVKGKNGNKEFVKEFDLKSISESSCQKSVTFYPFILSVHHFYSFVCKTRLVLY